MHKSKLLILNGILAFSVISSLSYIELSPANATLESEDGTDNSSLSSTETINYTTYTNNNIGITFEYPSEWDLDERTNRFANEPDVEVSEGLNSFKFTDSNPAFESFDLEFIAEIGKNTFTKGPDKRLIEDVDMNSYSIDGKDTATFLYTAIEDFEFVELEYATQVFFIENEGKIYSAIYRDTVSNFDDPQSQTIMNHILESFKFINSEDDNVSNNVDRDEDDGENN